MTVIIHLLSEKPEWVPICQKWEAETWPCSPEIEAFFSDHYQAAASNQGAGLPQTFIASRNNKPFGMISLIAEDHPDFQHLRPWLASGYVAPKMRGKGIAYILARAALMFARAQLKENYIYVHTHLDVENKGCEFMQETYDPFDPQKKVSLYRYDLRIKRND
jgi:GNAT superfamily N-acetyltransferase